MAEYIISQRYFIGFHIGKVFTIRIQTFSKSNDTFLPLIEKGFSVC